jgi:hypothetical protein
MNDFAVEIFSKLANNPQYCLDFAEIGLIEPLLTLFSNPKLIQQCLGILYNMAVLNEKTRKWMGDEGLIKELLNLTSKPDMKPHLQLIVGLLALITIEFTPQGHEENFLFPIRNYLLMVLELIFYSNFLDLKLMKRYVFLA